MQSNTQRAMLQQQSLVKNVPFRNIGPSVMSGRVVDVAVNPDRPQEMYVGYASGGLWYTTNNGTTFTPVMDNAQTINVGDIAVDWKNDVIWVGTGENNASRSSYAGIGILKSTDRGKSWKHLGLQDSHHIGRILLHPTNPDQVVVASTGHLYTPNDERGIFKTTDGGKTWSKTLFVNNETGIIDLAMSPNNPDIMMAAAWEKDRKAWNFKEAGKSSAIYKSTDGGSTWAKISEDSGFPTGDGVGRIGLSYYDDATIYAVHDSQFRRPADKKDGKDDRLSKDDFKTMSKEDFLALTDKKLNGFLKENGFQEKYRADNVKAMVRSGVVKPADLASYLEDANSLLFDTPVVGAEVYRSDDGGKTWNKTHNDYLDDIFYSYGYYFAQIRVNPKDKDHIYIMGVPILTSKDGGKTFKSISAENVHADHHALWINPKNPDHIVNGNDGGLNISYDGGENWIKNNQPVVGQFYAIQVDNQKPYHVYGGLQDNGVWVGAHTAQENKRWQQSGEYPWKSIMGGDGMQIEVDNRDPNIVYTGFQFGNYFRLNRKTDEQTYIQPKHELGERPYRFNWQTPILLSSHNQDILYLGGNKLMRSMNQGDDFTAISKDLTQGGKKGDVTYGTITTISESPFQFGLIYTGSDDGLIHVTKDSGGSWKNISAGLPKDLWVSRVVASQHDKATVYATLNGYRNDNFTSYIYKSTDYGMTWKDISSNIADSPVNVIAEDPKQKDILYVGTDNAAYVSLNGGKDWQLFNNGLPPVAVHDIKIQPEANDLLLGTHGRSIYIANLTPVQALSDLSAKNEALSIVEVPSGKWSTRWGSSWSKWLDAYEPSITLPVYANAAGEVTMKVLSPKGKELYTTNFSAEQGLNFVEYNLSLSEKGKKALEKERDDVRISKSKNGMYYLPKGEYTIEVVSGTSNDKKEFKVE
ncbi:hypothetical protein GCM10009117_07140 [Gangjinia marincola]|uniref:Sortilin N-terminal domain-containing protein n=2 Tax=Gangjinia marincola TaxID=578463 RepID=A0ABN1MER4_9FLAO